MNKLIFSIFVITISFQIDESSSKKLRISSGFDARITDVKCYTTFKVRFPNSDVYRRCGGCLIANNKVLTSAKCVRDPYDGTNATDATFSFGNYKITRFGYGISKVAYPPTYDYTNRKSPNDIAVITLNQAVSYNALLDKSTPSQVSTADAYVDQELYVCGFGDTDNFGNRPNILQCTYLMVIPASECLSSSGASASSASTTSATTTATTTIAGSTTTGSTTAGSTTAASSSPGVICTRNSDDRNVCHGDEGSPVFSNSTGTLELVGVVSYFPDVRSNAPCQDGHKVAITQVGSFSSFITTNLI